ncbi:MAG: ATP-binding protein [Bacilli bacterium]|nr:ATP-binding protein [Bacilli bacterium]
MVERTRYLDELIKLKDKHIIKVVTGIRRAGKSTLFTLYRKKLIEFGVDEKHIINLNFEDPEHMNFSHWKELYDYIEQKLDNNKMNYIFLDEIQIMPDFEKVVNGLFIKENVDLYITGSNSYMLSGELATFLTGRYMQIHILPLSFDEYMSAKEDKNEAKIFNEYLDNGGFPYLLSIDNDKALVRNYLDGIYNTILLKDVVYRAKIKDYMILESVVRFLFDNIGQMVSINKICNTLNTNNRRCSVNTIESYIKNLLDSFILYRVGRYDIKGKEYFKTGDKYYICDLGLRNYLLGEKRDLGSMLENIIFLELKRKNYQIYIGKYCDKEVDFVAINEKGLHYIQVALSVRDVKTLERELSSLKLIKDNYPKYLITLDFETVMHDGIKQINALEFLLGRTDL